MSQNVCFFVFWLVTCASAAQLIDSPSLHNNSSERIACNPSNDNIRVRDWSSVILLALSLWWRCVEMNMMCDIMEQMCDSNCYLVPSGYLTDCVKMYLLVLYAFKGQQRTRVGLLYDRCLLYSQCSMWRVRDKVGQRDTQQRSLWRGVSRFLPYHEHT